MYCICESNSVELQINLYIIIIVITITAPYSSANSLSAQCGNRIMNVYAGYLVRRRNLDRNQKENAEAGVNSSKEKHIKH